jgi:hypothetical protein
MGGCGGPPKPPNARDRPGEAGAVLVNAPVPWSRDAIGGTIGAMADTAQLIHQFREPVRSGDGVLYVAQAWGEQSDRWHAWLVFIAADGRILRTAREKVYASRDAVHVWALSLRPADLGRALARAIPATAELPAA